MTVNCIHCKEELFQLPINFMAQVDAYIFSCGCLRFRTIQDRLYGFQVMVDDAGKRLVTRIMWDGTVMLSTFPERTHIELFEPNPKYAGRYIESTSMIEVPFSFNIETISLERIKQFVKTALLLG